MITPMKRNPTKETTMITRNPIKVITMVQKKSNKDDNSDEKKSNKGNNYDDKKSNKGNNYGSKKYNKDDNSDEKKHNKGNNYDTKKYNKGDNSDENNYNKGNNYGTKKYNKGNNYNSNNYNKNSYGSGNNYQKPQRKKRSYSKVRFPVRHFKNIREFPHRRLPPLLSITPWLPIFYDRITYQTIIFSPTGGIYILPPLINFYGQRFAVAQLIKWGYASLVSSGAPPPPNVNVAPLVTPVAAGAPVVAGVVGGAAVAPAPVFDSKKVAFNGGVKTDFPAFKPRYENDYRKSGSSYGNNNGPKANYGGGNNQERYAQDGPRNNNGGGNNQERYAQGGPRNNNGGGY
ncbi:unnamed protein product [Adineta steineri]|uniref:Uncharacterized protein n=1 Tax=Adineta steineri TaxID=433720 RepID=A0A815QFT2_9BILA|nr:unnamed protein product [Adineta steineri]CAF4080789.1 unnamed protein product [Adineta steineri]